MASFYQYNLIWFKFRLRWLDYVFKNQITDDILFLFCCIQNENCRLNITQTRIIIFHISPNFREVIVTFTEQTIDPCTAPIAQTKQPKNAPPPLMLQTSLRHRPTFPQKYFGAKFYILKMNLFSNFKKYSRHT